MSEQVDTPAAPVFDGAQNAADLPAASGDGSVSGSGAEINLDALMDVQVLLSVEIGRTKVPIKQLISLN